MTAVVLPGIYIPLHDTSDWLTANDPVLVDGQIGYETDTGNEKINLTGADETWNNLPYRTKGAKGDPGPGPYDDAIARGAFAGTYEEYVAQVLKGDRGDDGDNAAVLTGTTVPVDGIAINAIFVRTAV